MNTAEVPVLASDKLHAVFARDERLLYVIANHSPQLARLRSSPMRRVMARVTTVAQAARLCNVPVESLVAELNAMLGVAVEGGPVDDITLPPPEHGVLHSRPHERTLAPSLLLDVRDELKNGGEPFSRIMLAAASLEPGRMLHLRAPFEPVPLFAVMAKRGFGHWTEMHAEDDWSVWFYHQADDAQKVDPSLSGLTAGRAPAPATSVAARNEIWLDVRNLEPPEPMARTLEALEDLPPETVLVQLNERIPQFLLPVLRERGFLYEIDEPGQDEVHVRIWRAESAR